MAHPTAKLTPFGRLLLVQRVLELGWSVTAAAEAVGVSRATPHRWLARYREEGLAGLADRSSRPHRSPHALDEAAVQDILRVRRALRSGPHRLAAHLGHSRSTTYGVLRRHGYARLSTLDRSTGVPIHSVRERPGELVHLDVKQLARIPDGGGHRLLGRAIGRQRQRGASYDYVQVAVDDASRLAYVEVSPDQRGSTAARFLLAAARFFADHGIQIERVLTDRAFAFTQAHAFREAMASLGARHCTTRPAVPTADEREGRAVHPHAPGGVSVRSLVPDERGGAGRTAGLAHVL